MALSDGTCKTAQGGTMILLVDDQPEVREVLEEALSDAGYECVAAASGTEALRLAADGIERLQLLLTDVVMPGMSGFELAERFRQLFPGKPVVLMTGFYSPTVGSTASAEFPILHKPFPLHQMIQAVQSALGDVSR